MSPAVAAATAIAGTFATPADLDLKASSPMDPVTIVTGTAVPLDRSDVDTDQIIPSDWLKRVERTGFGEGLFSEWRDDPEFVLNHPQFGEASILVAGRELRDRLVARARRLGDHGLRLRGRRHPPLRRHLPQQLPPRTASCRCEVDPEVGEQLLRAVEADPTLEITVDVRDASGSRRRPSGSTSSSPSTTPPRTASSTASTTSASPWPTKASITSYEATRPSWMPRSAPTGS